MNWDNGVTNLTSHMTAECMATKSVTATGVAPKYDFEESIGYWIVLAAQAFQNALNDELAPHGITFRQCQVLGWLMHDGEISQVALAQRMMIEPATLVGVLDRMERDRLIVRRAGLSDRRRKMITMHPNATEVWNQVAACAKRVRARASEGLTNQQLALLKKTLKTVLGNLEPIRKGV